MLNVNIEKTTNAFVRALGNGEKASKLLLEIVEWTLESEHTDSTKLSGIMDKARRVGDKNAEKAVRAIVGAIWTDGKVRMSKDEKTTVLKLGKTVDGAALERLQKGVASGLSLRDTLVKEVKGDVEKKELVLTDYAEKLVKRMNKEGVTKAALIAAIQAA